MVISDNGTELIGNAVREWQEDRKVEWHHIAPGKQMQIGPVDSFNGWLRAACVTELPFSDLRHACQPIETGREDYNHHRPHKSLDGRTPREYHHRAENDQTLRRANL